MVNITKIKSLAKSKGIKYSYICEKLGLKKGYLNDVASGKAVMHDDRINTVAEILGTTYEYLTDQTDDPEPTPQSGIRYEHSLGVMNIAGQIAEQAELMGLFEKLSADDKKTVLNLARRLAGE